jgi:hypothetical protein
VANCETQQSPNNDQSTILDSDASPLDEQQQQSNTAAAAQAEQVLRGQREGERIERHSLFV